MSLAPDDGWTRMQRVGYYARIRHTKSGGMFVQPARRIMVDESMRDETKVAHDIGWDRMRGCP